MNSIEFRGITKKIGDFYANDRIDLVIQNGEIHCLLGENGAGKTTLMNTLFGLYTPDAGDIFINENPCRIPHPGTAIQLGMGMIHQHFMLAGRLTVMENIIAGKEPLKNGFVDKKKRVTRSGGFVMNTPWPLTPIKKLKIFPLVSSNGLRF